MKTYIGDGVYADFDGHNVILTTEYGVKVRNVSNVIYLEPSVYKNLAHFVERLKKEA